MSGLDLLTQLYDDHLLLVVLCDLEVTDRVLSITEHHTKEVLCEVIDQRMYTRLIRFECFAELFVVLFPNNLLNLLDEQLNRNCFLLLLILLLLLCRVFL